MIDFFCETMASSKLCNDRKSVLRIFLQNLSSFRATHEFVEFVPG